MTTREKNDYRVTRKAGPFVAGVRNPGTGKTLQLTEEGARYGVIAGELVPSDKWDEKLHGSAEDTEGDAPAAESGTETPKPAKGGRSKG
ncbi:hypothetical protein GGD81_001380 [Rhodobium orientis]|uniref:Uncharacterized protein n=1 Tax=Rhodobium orientis TaxID=34017 RepID=A0A327JL39_9HYPH|nr:hypothetical protein [Rhodobium orientis]MBB4302353.1 hypothetical protein [Rhodobium orientis]MBK5949058.1 hypothetical protein [Rhodobium orientis]RAI26615.1 hypothetical protein CH339_13520 [Rhodobium orientis]